MARGYDRPLIALALLASVLPAGAQTAEEFYRGKRELVLITSSSAGGGYDQYSRLLGRYMTRYLPGNPSIIVQNMVGGGGIRAANFIYNVAPRDGTAFSLIDRGMPTAPLLYGDKSQARFDAPRFSWIGSLMRETGMGVIATRSVVKSITDAKTHEIFFGSTGPETDTPCSCASSTTSWAPRSRRSTATRASPTSSRRSKGASSTACS